MEKLLKISNQNWRVTKISVLQRRLLLLLLLLNLINSPAHCVLVPDQILLKKSDRDTTQNTVYTPAKVHHLHTVKQLWLAISITIYIFHSSIRTQHSRKLQLMQNQCTRDGIPSHRRPRSNERFQGCLALYSHGDVMFNNPKIDRPLFRIGKNETHVAESDNLYSITRCLIQTNPFVLLVPPWHVLFLSVSPQFVLSG